jgi:hypothetical protein
VNLDVNEFAMMTVAALRHPNDQPIAVDDQITNDGFDDARAVESEKTQELLDHDATFTAHASGTFSHSGSAL